jgi:hypothetical protein
MLRLATLAVTGLALAALTLSIPAAAIPTFSQFGGQLFYAGGDVTVDVVYHDTTFGEFLQLWAAGSALQIADGSLTGSRVTLTQQQLAELGFKPGDELMFGIHVVKTNRDYLLGPGSRNSDGIDHAYVRWGGASTYAGFEDIFGGGDRDYNDTVFRFSGVRSNAKDCLPASSVAEPGAVILMLSGILLLGLALWPRAARSSAR